MNCGPRSETISSGTPDIPGTEVQACPPADDCGRTGWRHGTYWATSTELEGAKGSVGCLDVRRLGPMANGPPKKNSRGKLWSLGGTQEERALVGALEARALEGTLEVLALEWGWVLRTPGVTLYPGGLGLEPAGLTAERRGRRRACSGHGRRHAWGSHRWRHWFPHERQTWESRGCWRACVGHERRSWLRRGRRQAWGSKRRQRACVLHEQQAWLSHERRRAWVSDSWQAWLGNGGRTRRRAGSGSGQHNFQTLEDPFPPAQSSGVWEVHGAMVICPDPKQGVQRGVIKLRISGDSAKLPRKRHKQEIQVG